MIEWIEKRLQELVPYQDETIFKAARYSLLSPGKRIRPRLVLATTESLGADPKLALDPACALEMVHTYSLIHDDLPCMDDDDLRRGKPTLHKVYGEDIATLTGDYLLTYAFQVIVAAEALSAEQKLALVESLARYAGAPGLISGQVTDLESKEKPLDEATLQKMHIHKTGALLTAALEFGRIIAGKHIDAFVDLGASIGLYYQIRDDLEDATQENTPKATAVSLLGTTKAKETLFQLQQSIHRCMHNLRLQNSPLFTLIGQILD